LEPTFYLALVNIIVIDLVLSGDNAVVIALAVKHLPRDIAKQAAIWGALGAVGLRVVFAALAALLLNVPLLQALGGLVLFWIAYKLLVEEEEDALADKEVHGFWSAVKIIVMADLVMSLDNILAVGGASHGNLWLLLFGLAVSIPLVLFGSTLLTELLRRWPVLAYVGSAVLAWTAGRMIVHDAIVHARLAVFGLPLLDTLLPSLGVAAVVGMGYRAQKRLEARAAEQPAS
jgi:YjbE family integral membrane protein